MPAYPKKKNGIKLPADTFVLQYQNGIDQLYSHLTRKTWISFKMPAPCLYIAYIVSANFNDMCIVKSHNKYKLILIYNGEILQDN